MDAGRLLLCLGVGLASPPAQPDLLPRLMDTLASRYSRDLCRTVQFFLQAGSKGPPRGIAELLPMISGHVLASLERSHRERDQLESQLQRELENGRLFRLLAKLGVITERPE